MSLLVKCKSNFFYLLEQETYSENRRRSIYHDLHRRKPQENSRQFKIIKDANMKYRLNLDYQHQRAIYQKNNETDFEALIRSHSEELMVVVDIPSYRLMYTFIERERVSFTFIVDPF